MFLTFVLKVINIQSEICSHIQCEATQYIIVLTL